MNVEILNPDVVKNLYQNHGEFACVCYNTPDKYAAKVGKSCQESGHMSGSRCEYIKFKITGVDRGTAEQCLRHEIGTHVPFEMQDNYTFDELDTAISDYMEQVLNVNPAQIVKNMASFRYIDKDGFEWATPKYIAAYEDAKRVYDNTMRVINENRKKIKQILELHGVDSHRANEDANFVLPRATTTDFVIGFTPEALIHFCHKRLCKRAQNFIREIAILMKREVAKYNKDFAEKELVPHCQHLLWCPEGTHSCGAWYTKKEVEAALRGYDPNHDEDEG